MRGMRRVGTAVAVAMVLGLGVAGCGSADADPSAIEVEESAESSPEDELLWPDDPGAIVVEPDPEPTDQYEDTDASATFDLEAEANGWVFEDYAQPSEWVLMMCESMDAWGAGATETLAANHVPEMTDEEKAALGAGAPALCPKHKKAVSAALKGDVDRATMHSGSYEIVKNPGLEEEKALPGTYRTAGDLENCYWERSTQSGDIIANHSATQARKITVTVRAGELFNSEGCGTWTLVK
ncbi:hypothetical protein ACIOWI_29705 [Streptomyces sp. NPDC087659]|uniref:hypothetical protein n=1 Tax=Streptomyces sp. NPDC087659 TaxID=3365801 RepID=UPI00381375BC